MPFNILYSSDPSAQNMELSSTLSRTFGNAVKPQWKPKRRIQ